jgi:hypothetical protein
VSSQGGEWDQSLGAITSAGDYVAVFVAKDNAYTAEVRMTGVALEGEADISVYRGDEQSDGESAISVLTEPVENGDLSFDIDIPEHSVIGVKVTGESTASARPILHSRQGRAPTRGAQFDIRGRVISTTPGAASASLRQLPAGVYITQNRLTTKVQPRALFR